jgi:hypothetical protein
VLIEGAVIKAKSFDYVRRDIYCSIMNENILHMDVITIWVLNHVGHIIGIWTLNYGKLMFTSWEWIKVLCKKLSLDHNAKCGFYYLSFKWERVIKFHVVELKVIMFNHFKCASAKHYSDVGWYEYYAFQRHHSLMGLGR